MKNSIKVAFIAAVAIAGIAACTPSQNAAPATSTESSAPGTTAPSSTSPSTSVVTEVVTSTVTPPAQPQAVAKTVDNRPGYGVLKLGMTPPEAEAAGQVVNWGIDGDPYCRSNDKVAISLKYGIVRITLPVEAKTSAGIGVGSTYADVKKAYPAATEYRAGYSVKLQGYVYQFQGAGNIDHFKDTDKVKQIRILAHETDCSFAVL